MIGPDLFNGLFELLGAAISTLNVRQLLRDKMVRGVHWAPVAFFMAWGFWNLFYYPHLDQWWSFAGGIALVAVNVVRLWLMGLYIWREKYKQWWSFATPSVRWLSGEVKIDWNKKYNEAYNEVFRKIQRKNHEDQA